MLATRSLTAPNGCLSSDDELSNHVVCNLSQTVFKIVGLMSFVWLAPINLESRILQVHIEVSRWKEAKQVINSSY